MVPAAGQAEKETNLASAPKEGSCELTISAPSEAEHTPSDAGLPHIATRQPPEFHSCANWSSPTLALPSMTRRTVSIVLNSERNEVHGRVARVGVQNMLLGETDCRQRRERVHLSELAHVAGPSCCLKAVDAETCVL